MTGALPRRLAVAAAAIVCLAAAGRATAATSPLAGLVLPAAQVGAGYTLHQRADGRGVKNLATLDVCGFAYPSEKLRTDRLQVDYTRTARTPSLSNEVVAYKPGKAAQAMAEVRSAVLRCPKKAVPSSSAGGVPLTWRVTVLKDPKLAASAVAIGVQVTATVNGKERSQVLVAVYQVRGDILSGVYAYPGTKTTALQLEAVAFHAAESSARLLGQVA